MVRHFVLLVLMCHSIELFSQQKHNYDKLGISIPFVWNNSNGVYYSLGNRREPVGNALSYGFNLNYSHFLINNIFIIGGAGYYKQRFNIERPFEYRSPDGTRPLVSTKRYYYQNIHFLIGFGYQKKVAEKWAVGGQFSYNIYSSFKQKYIQMYSPDNNEFHNRKFMMGNTINLDIKFEHYLNSRVSIEGAVVFPVLSYWNDDLIFIKYGYANDTQTIAKSKMSIGANFSFCYKYKK